MNRVCARSTVLVGEALHLDRVLDAALLLRRQARVPPTSRSASSRVGAVAVVGDLDLDHARDRGRVAARGVRALLELASSYR